MKLKLFIASIFVSTFGMAQCTTPQPTNFPAGSTVVIENTNTTPPTALYVFTLEADCTLLGVGNPNITGSWSSPAAGNLGFNIVSATYNGNIPLTLTSLTISFYTGGGGYSPGAFLYPAPMQTTVNFATGQVSTQALDPYNFSNGGSAYQLVLFPKGF